MESIIIGTYPNHTETYDEIEAWQEECRDRIKDIFGIRPGSIYVGMEYVARNGELYWRDPEMDKPFFQSLNEYDQKKTDEPDVLCECGSVQFTLRYGFYEIKARCVGCGKEEVVYDG